MKIKDWAEAINLAIERHQAALKGECVSYNIALRRMRQEDWKYDCPLCEYVKGECKKCLWEQYTNGDCGASTKYSIHKHRQSIARLEEWREKEIEEEK